MYLQKVIIENVTDLEHWIMVFRSGSAQPEKLRIQLDPEWSVVACVQKFAPKKSCVGVIRK
jgi:hypothetical protein